MRVGSPCVAIQVGATAADARQQGVVGRVAEKLRARPRSWLVAEQRVPVLPQDGGEPAAAGEVSELAARLQNEHGCCDLSQAFLSSPLGRQLLPADLLPTPEYASGGSGENASKSHPTLNAVAAAPPILRGPSAAAGEL